MFHQNGIIQMLLNEELDRRANVETVNRYNNTPLHLAAYNGDAEVVQKLLDKKANVKAMNRYHNTPLHLAAQNGHVEVAQKLLDKKANVKAVNQDNGTPLHLAAKYGHSEVVQKLLNNGANIEAANQDNDTPLHVAAYSGHAEVVQKLLDKKANVEAVNRYKNTPLHFAAQTGNSEVMQKLLNSGANTEAVNQDNNTPLHLAAQTGNSEVMQKLLNSGANTEAVNQDNNTPLHLAAQIGHTEVVQKLLDKKANFEAINKYNNTSLHLAAFSNHAEVVQKLLDKKANFEAINKYNNTPLHLAAQIGNSEVVQKLLNSRADVFALNEQNNTPLHLAAQIGNSKIVQKLLNSGADVLAVNEQNNTPLHLATQIGHTEIVEKLLNSGANIHAVNEQNNTPLHVAARNGHVDIVEKLLKNGANIEAVNQDNNTPLHLTAKSGNSEIVEKLLNSGANVHAVNDQNYTPLHVAARNGHVDVVEKLLKNGADVNKVNGQNNTPLHLAAQTGHAEVVQALLDKNASVKVINLNNDTPLHFAAKNGNAEVVQKLLKNGADVNKVNSQSTAPLHFAAQSGHAEVVQALLDKNASVKIRTTYNNTPLHFAARNDYVDVVEKLLHSGADINAVNIWKETPLHFAAENDNAEVIQKLLNSRAGVNAVNGQNNTPLHLAARKGKLAVVEKLLNSGADIDAVNFQKETPLHLAAENDDAEVIQKLLNSRINVNVVNGQNNTLLHFAARKGKLAVVEKLLNSGADIDAVNVRQETPLHFAARKGKLAVVEKLLNSGADIDAVNIRQETPLHLAAENGDEEVVQALLNDGANVKKQNNRGHTPLESAVFNNKESVGKALIKYILLQDIDTEKPNFSILIGRLHETISRYWDECKSKIESKIESMKEINIGTVNISPNQRNQDVSLYDFFTAGDTKLGLYVKQLNVLLNPNHLLEDFPNFTEIFLYKIKKGLLYNIIRDTVIISTKGESEEQILPRELTEEINKYLDDESRSVVLRTSTPPELIEFINRYLSYENWRALLEELARLQRNNQNQERGEPRPLDTAKLNREEVSTWEKPKISNATEHGTPTRFDGQIILQLENDPVVMEAAVRLATKHPESSVIVQLDNQGNYKEVSGNLNVLKGESNLRWQVVGHGRGDTTNKTLGGYSATALAEKIADFTTTLNIDYDINSAPKYISLVGCSLIDNVEMNYAREFALSLDEQGIRADIAARSERVAVSDAGKKLTEDSAGNWNHKISEDKVIYAWNEDGELVLQIGQRAAQLLKSMDLAQNFHQAMSELYKSNQLPEGKWWPILRNATKDTQAQVQFMNAEQQPQTVITHDRRITDFIEDYNEKLATINETYSNAGTDVKSIDRSFDVESVDGLNSAFIVKTLIPWFANKSRMAAADDDVPETLKTALQVHTWVNLAQMGHGAVEDITKTAQLYRAAIAISEGKEIASEMTSSLQHISTGIGIFLNIGSVVLDSIELAHAQNEAQKAIYGTQLAFDSAGLVTSVVGIGASIAGATTIAAFTGAGGVILGGLGIGVTALAESFSEVAMNAQAVGTYFANLDAAYSQGGYRHTTKTMKDGTAYDVMEPIPGAVITMIDLPNKQLTFDSQYIYRTHHNFEGSGNNFRWGMPDIILDKAQAINIREGIGYPTAEVSFDYDSTTLILPTTPKSYFNYEYNLLPFVLERHDRGFEVLRRLEEDGRFDFDFYTFPGERVVCKVIPEYMETSIEIILDGQDRDILIPQLPQHIKGKLSYQLRGNGGEYRISLQDGVSLSLHSDNLNTKWVLDARQLDSVKPSIHENLLKLGDVQITLPDKSHGNISITGSNGEIFTINRESKEITLLEANDRQFTDWQALHEHLKLYSHSDNHNSFVTVDNYQPVGGDNVGRAFYDVSADRFIYTNKPEWSEFLSSAALAKVEGDKAWLYNKTEIWQVEIATGKILKQYLPFNGDDMEFISSSALQHDNQLYMVIEQKMDNNNVTYTYHVEDEALKLVAIDGDTALRTKLENSNERNLSSISVLPTSDHQLARMLTSDHQVKATPADMIRISDWWLFFDEHGVKDFVKANAEPKDLVLAFISDHTGYFFYSNQEHIIYFQKDNGLSGTQAIAVDVNNVKSIFSHNQKHFALTSEGTLWSLDDQGTAKLAGVTADWLSHHKQNLIKDLGELVHDTTNKFNSLLLLGKQDNNGNPVKRLSGNR